MHQYKKLMKKLATILFTAIALSLFSQESVVLNHRYVPNQKLEQKTSMETISEIQFIGDEEVLALLEKSGTSAISTENSLMEMETIATSSALDSENCFDIEVLYTKAELNNEEIVSTGTRIIGDICEDEDPEFYDIVNSTMDPDVKDMTLDLISSLVKQLDLNHLVLKKGVPYNDLQTLKLSLAVLEIDMLIEITYTLKSIENGMAYIDFVQKSSANSEVKDYPVHLTGYGKGQLVYDTINNLIILYESNISQNILMDMGFFKSKINQQITQKQEYKIIE